MARKQLWMQKLRRRMERRGTEGALHRQLEIPKTKRIPITLLEEIRTTPIGKRIRNPTKTGKRRITVTRLLKQRAVAALNMRRARD